MGVEMIKDRQGKDHLVLSDEDFYNDDIMGDKLEDYEILQVLSKENPTGFTSKVRSKLNSKIYAMKKIKEDYTEYGDEDDIQKEFGALKNMKSPNITKYFKYFYQGSCLYIVYEYLNNTDLEGYLNAYKTMGKPIDTNTLWNIFMQCISALKYCHSKKIIHKNIRLSNIFMSENNIIKLGDFRFSFLERDSDLIEKNKDYIIKSIKNNIYYNEKTDIYALGIVFHALCYFTPINNPLSRKNEDIYPEEMTEIIELMLKKEKDIPDINVLYDKIMEQYIKNVAKISSVDSVFRCMFSFKNFTQLISQKEESFKEDITPISFNYIKCIETYKNNKDENNQKENAKYLNNFRNLLYNNSQINNQLEIKPSLVIDFLLEKLNKETCSNFSGPSLGIHPVHFENDKNKSLSDFNKYFNEHFTSDISKYFIGFLRRTRICKKCNEGFYSFNIFPYIEFNLELIKKNKIQKWFKEQNERYLDLSENINIECKQCNCITSQYEYKQFFEFPHNFIISLNRGEGFKNNTKIEYPIELDLSDAVEKKDSYLKFNLVGVVKRMIDPDKGNEYYCALYFDPYQNCWFSTEDNKIVKIKDPKEKPIGMVMLLFYSAQENIGL